MHPTCQLVNSSVDAALAIELGEVVLAQKREGPVGQTDLRSVQRHGIQVLDGARVDDAQVRHVGGFVADCGSLPVIGREAMRATHAQVHNAVIGDDRRVDKSADRTPTLVAATRDCDGRVLVGATDSPNRPPAKNQFSPLVSARRPIARSTKGITRALSIERSTKAMSLELISTERL